MTSINRELFNEIRKHFCDAGQGHVFSWWDELTSEERERLYQQLTSIDLDLINRLVEKNLAKKGEKKERRFEPTAVIALPTTEEEIKSRRKAREIGEQMIRDGKCSAFVVAGSGDEDLDTHRIKGKHPITPVTGKSLFQLHTEKVLALRKRYKVNIPFFVMTSPDNHEETQAYFEANNYFGLSGEDIFFFMQGMLPAVDLSGKLIMLNRGRLWMGPDGHGGSIRSLYTSGALEEMERRGIQYIFYFQVDNPLTVVLDPMFLGFHHMADASISSKVVRKRGPEERVGVLGSVNGSPGVVEYTDLSKEEKYAKDEEGHLKFYAGNTAMHILNVDFVRKLSTGSFKLDFHTSPKAIDTIDENGDSLEAQGNNAYKFESFVFDALQYARATVSLEIARSTEFSPFKELDGEDSPETCRRAMSHLYKSWLQKAGFSVNEDESMMVEISPLFALDVEEFCHKVKDRAEIFSQKLFIG
ncbi:MAG: UTP--glucose-1-phosphate uridylyltransferase [Planctomycetota bacterium]|jgi:UDP-N-acetylglucosamine/UDP-N-acetylgalactosamine diphosphorylase